MVIQFKVKESKLTQLSAAWVVANSYNYVRAQFNFASNDWDDKPKTAIFTFNGREYPVTLDRNDSCRVPWEVLMPPQFYVYVIGGSLDSEIIATNSCPIDVHPSSSLNYYDNAARNPSPDIYQQILDVLQNKQDQLIPGDNIEIDTNNVISATGGDCDGHVYVPTISEDKILTLTLSNEPGEESISCDLNPFDEWTEIDGVESDSTYVWQEI